MEETSMVFTAAKTVVAAYVGVLFLWVLYLSIMNIARARDAGRLTKPAYVFGLQIYWFAYLLDILMNWSLLSLILLNVPREATMTQHLNRMLTRTDWRQSVAAWMCRHLLDPFDPNGCHCKHPVERDEHSNGGI